MKRLILIALALFISACATPKKEKDAEAIELNRSDAKVYYNRGTVYLRKGQYEPAISNFTKAIRLKSDYAKAYINRGIAYFSKGQFDQAISDSNKAIELNPNLAEAYVIRGSAYYYKRDYDNAWKDVHKAESLGYQVPPTFLKNLRVASKKSPCKPFRKKIDCEYFDHWQCREELEKFGNTFIEQFNLTRKKYTHLTVNIGEGVFYNLKYSIDFNIPALYVDITHCVNGEVTEKKRINLGGEYR